MREAARTYRPISSPAASRGRLQPAAIPAHLRAKALRLARARGRRGAARAPARDTARGLAARARSRRGAARARDSARASALVSRARDTARGLAVRARSRRGAARAPVLVPARDAARGLAARARSRRGTARLILMAYMRSSLAVPVDPYGLLAFLAAPRPAAWAAADRRSASSRRPPRRSSAARPLPPRTALSSRGCTLSLVLAAAPS